MSDSKNWLADLNQQKADGATIESSWEASDAHQSKVGRPSKTIKEKRKQRGGLNLSDAEFELVSNVLELSGKSLGVFIREAVLEKARKLT